MRAETIAIGTELTTGAKLDTNSQWISIELAAIGIHVHYHTTVADDLDANIDVIRIASQRADLVVLTGGLGPTLDDLTRDALARAAGVDLVLDQPALDNIRAMFARRKREMPERNRIQAMFPRGATIVPNPRGTAPGIAMELPRDGKSPCFVVALPGVPSEMKPMFSDWVVPRLMAAGAGTRVIRRARINCFGLGESACEELLGDITARGRDPEVGITVHEATITLRIVAEGDSVEECVSKIADTRKAIVTRLGEWIFGDEDEELHHVVIDKLSAAGQTVAVAEGETGGLVAHLLSMADPSATVFRGGVVLRGGTPLAEFNADGEQVPSPVMAEQLAKATRDKFGTTFGVAITPPTAVSARGNVEQDTPPSTFIAVAGEDRCRSTEVNLAGDPAITRVRVAKTALNLLRLVACR